ncbi:MAG: hypothetical protein ABUK08_09130, partial [Candidatus Humimicrobiaceae bacterium]
EMAKLAEQLDSQDSSNEEDSGNNSIFIKYGDLKKDLDQKMAEWEILHSEFEELKKNPYYVV